MQWTAKVSGNQCITFDSHGKTVRRDRCSDVLWRLLEPSGGAEVTRRGSLLQVEAAATENTRSPTVRRRGDADGHPVMTTPLIVDGIGKSGYTSKFIQVCVFMYYRYTGTVRDNVAVWRQMVRNGSSLIVGQTTHQLFRKYDCLSYLVIHTCR